jgi:hypothetical protein
VGQLGSPDGSPETSPLHRSTPDLGDPVPLQGDELFGACEPLLHRGERGLVPRTWVRVGETETERTPTSFNPPPCLLLHKTFPLGRKPNVPGQRSEVHEDDVDTERSVPAEYAVGKGHALGVCQNISTFVTGFF